MDRLAMIVAVFLSLVGLCSCCPIECTCNTDTGNICTGLKKAPNSDVLIASSTEWYFENGHFPVLPLDSFGDTVLGYSPITKLSFHGGEIKELPDGVFKSLSNLRELDLSNNQLSYVSRATFEGLVKLERLNLSNNYIWTYEPDAFKYLPSLKFLDIKSSDFSCDASTKGLRKFIEEQAITLPDDNICQHPAELRGAVFSQLPAKEFRVFEFTYPRLFISPESRQIVFEEDSLALNCSASMHSRGMHIQWLLDSRPVNQSSARLHATTIVHNGLFTSMLVISPLASSDTGRWECQVKSDEESQKLGVDVMVMASSSSYCPRSSTRTPKGNFNWPKTVAGFPHAQEAPCPFGRSALFTSDADAPRATRRCEVDGTWAEPDDSACEFESILTRELSKLTLEVLTKENYLWILRNVSLLTTDGNRIENVQDIIHVSDLVSSVWSFMHQETANFVLKYDQITDNVLRIVSNLMGADPSLLLAAEQSHKSCSNLLLRLKQYSALTSNSAQDLYRSKAPNAVVRTFRVLANRANHGFTCALTYKSQLFHQFASSLERADFDCYSPGTNLSSLSSNVASNHEILLAAISLPPEAFARAGPTGADSRTQFFKVQFIVFRNASLFPSPYPNTEDAFPLVPSGPVASTGILFGGMEDLGNEASLPSGVSMEIALASYSSKHVTPSVWNMEDSHWSTETGCSRAKCAAANCSLLKCSTVGSYTLLDTPEGFLEGLWPFWYLIQRVEPVVQAGAALCILFCFLVILTYISLYSRITMGKRSVHILLNLALCIILLSCLFAWGVLFTQHMVTCRLLGVALHYCTLSASLWLLAFCRNVSSGPAGLASSSLSVDNQTAVSGSSGRGQSRGHGGLFKYYVVGWGLPALVCCVTAFATMASYGGNSMCWMRYELALVTLVVPVGVIGLVAGGYLVRVLLQVPNWPDCDKLDKPRPTHFIERLPTASVSQTTIPAANIVNGGSIYASNPHFHHYSIHQNNAAAAATLKCDMPSMAEFDPLTSEPESYFARRSTHSTHSSPPFTPVNLAVPGSQAHTSSIANHLTSKCQYKLRSAVVVFLSMSLCWTFGALVLLYDRKCHWVFSYLYGITSAFLGFFLCLNYCLLRKDVKQAFASLFCHKSPSKRSHSVYHQYSAGAIQNRKSSGSSMESGMLGNGKAYPLGYVRPQKARSGGHLVGNTTANSYHFTDALMSSNPDVRLHYYIQSAENGGLIQVPCAPVNASHRPHMRNAQTMQKLAGSRSGSSARDLDLVSLPDAKSLPGRVFGSRSQTSIPDSFRNGGAASSTGGASDHERRATPGQNTPVTISQVTSGRGTPLGQPPPSRCSNGYGQYMTNRRSKYEVPIATIPPNTRQTPTPDIIRGSVHLSHPPSPTIKTLDDLSDCYSTDSSSSGGLKKLHTSRSTLDSDKQETGL